MMTSLESLHFAIGELAYAMASADGTIQKSERQKFHDIVATELEKNHFDFNISDIIFQIMEKGKNNTEDTYTWAMNQIKLNGHYLSPQLKETFINVAEQIANAYPPVTKNEESLLERFKKNIANINGDPVYYSKNS